MNLSDEQRRKMDAYIEREDTKHFKILQESVEKYSPPHIFSLDSIQDRHVPRLIKLLNTNPKITALYIGDSSISNYGIKMLAEKLLYITKLHLDAVSLCEFEHDTNTIDALLALAKSKIRSLMILRTVMTNEEADVLIENSLQIKLNLRDNRHVDDERVRLADRKAEENSQKELMLFGSSRKRQKQDSDEAQNLKVDTPPERYPE